MKKFILLEKNSIMCTVELSTSSSDEETSALLQNGFSVMEGEYEASSSTHALDAYFKSLAENKISAPLTLSHVFYCETNQMTRSDYITYSFSLLCLFIIPMASILYISEGELNNPFVAYVLTCLSVIFSWCIFAINLSRWKNMGHQSSSLIKCLIFIIIIEMLFEFMLPSLLLALYLMLYNEDDEIGKIRIYSRGIENSGQ